MAGYAVVTTTQVMKVEALPVNTAAQKADSHTWSYLEGERTFDIQRPKEAVVMHCKAHQFGQTVVNVGNRLADKTAREAAEQSILALVPLKQVKLPTPKPNYGKLDGLLAKQLRAVENEDGWWVTPTRQVIVTPQIMIKIAEEKQRETHWGTEATIVDLQKSRLLDSFGNPDGTLLLNFDGSERSQDLQPAPRDSRGEPPIPGPKNSEQDPLEQ
ncbi:hypothetical protein QYF61_004247, partial [Mycteria americana]